MIPLPPGTIITISEEAGARLKAARKAADLTQVEVAQELGLDQSRISRIEQGGTTMFWSDFLLATKLYNVDPAEIIEGRAA